MLLGKQRLSLLFVFILLSVVCIVYGENTDYCFKQISADQGLSQSSVRCILNDHTGVIWIGTKNGLNRFDQYELENYYHQESPNSLPDNDINFITEDSLHTIWVGTAKGLAIYNRENNNFIPVTLNNELFPVYSFYNCSTGVIFGGFGALYIYEYTTKSIRRIECSNNLPLLEYNHVMNWTDEFLILGSRYGGIYAFNKKSRSVKELHFDTKKDITALYTDKKERIWLSPYGEGLYCFDSRGNKVLHITRSNSNLNNDIILDIIERDGNIWLATDGGGINVYNPENSKIEIINEEAGDSYSLPETSILCLYNDIDNNLWAGTIRGGLLRIKEVFIRTYKNVPLNVSYGLSNKVVISLYEDYKRVLWIGTDGGGINSYDPQKKKFIHYLETYSNKVVSIIEYSENQLLVSFFDKGIFLFDKQSRKLSPFIIIDQVTNAEECKTGSSVYLDRCSKDKILILGKRVYVYDIVDRRFSTVADVNTDYQKSLQKIMVGDSISYLMGQYHLAKLNCVTQKMEIIYDNKGGMALETAAFDGKKSIWLGTKNGLYCFNLSDKTVNRIETNLFHSVSSLTYDDRGRLWVGAQNMLFCFQPDRNRFIILGESDGVYPNELFHTSIYKSLSDMLYLGGASGLLCIDKNIIFESDILPTVQLSDVIINGVSKLSELTSDSGNEITVPWNTTSIEIKLSTKEKDIFRKKMFRYSIVGLNKQYIESYNRTLNLASLPPGNYIVRVSCSSQSGVWSTPTDVLQISVVPPVWKTGWFIGGCILLGILFIAVIVYLIIRKNKNQLKWRMKEHEKEVDEEKIRFLINVSHELRTPLTLVYAPLKRILERREIKDEVLDKELVSIFKHTRQMKDLINMVLDVRRMEVGHDSLKLESHDLNQWVCEVSDGFQNEFASKNIRIEYQLDDAITSVSFDRTKCEIVLSNLLINALKYSLPDTQVIVSTQLLQNERMVRIAVIDRGIGLKDIDLNKLFTRFYKGNHEQSGSGIGLSYSKMLIEMHKGHIGAMDNLNSPGATFYFDLLCSEPSVVINCEPRPYLNELLHLEELSKQEIDNFDTKTYSILVVEDNADMNRFLQKVLKEHFLHVYAAKDGCEAIEIVRDRTPDLVVSDVMMPRMDGFELCRTIKNDLNVSHVPVVLLTARNDSESNIMGYKMGADGYLAKPFETELLISVLKNVLSNREKIKFRYKHSSFLPSVQESTISNADEKFLLKINQLINDNLDNPMLDVKYLTDKMAMSRASLYNKVRALTDMGVNDYINKFRIDKAIDLLMNTDLSITEISEQAGFSYQRYFSSVFKQVKGVTPSQFRQKVQEGKENK